MEGFRIKRLSKQIQKDLGEIFLALNKDYFRGKMISVTEVRLTADLSIAKVYLSIFPPQDADEIMTQIEQLKSQVRFELGNRLRNTVRKIPELRFFNDPTFENLEKIDKLLKEDKKQNDKDNEI